MQVVSGDVFRRGNFDADDDVGAHCAKYIGWEIVHQAAVDQQLVAHLDRRKHTRDGHAGPHCGRHAAAAQHYFVACNQVRCHAGEGDRHVVEVHLLLIAYA